MIKIKEIQINLFPGASTLNRAQVENINVNLSVPVDQRQAAGDLQLGTEDANGNFVFVISKAFILTSDQYATWGTDDFVAEALACKSLGLEPA